MKTLNISILSLACIALAGCSGTKETLGLTKTAPDEFQVVKRAPLEMPPSYTLRPPSPGAPRPQEQATVEQARSTVLGGQTGSGRYAPTESENALLSQAGAGAADPNIRRTVDEETANLVDKDQPVVDKLLNLTTGKSQRPASVVDAKAEAARIQKNAQEGKPVTEGETPTID